jgi:NADPH:quinone reductase-like Zn-dependent oxidoreductase
VPEDGLTSLFSLKRLTSDPGSPLVAGSPWANKTNVTVVITSGSGGTGSFGIALAKAYGATNIWTATTGDKGTAFVKGLGATLVVDYKKQDIFDALADNSVDFVYDNYGAAGTADKAMRVIRPGGTYLLMPHGACFVDNSQKPPCVAANPKPGVRQLNFATGKRSPLLRGRLWAVLF